MTSLDALLASLTTQPLGTVVVLGAGAGQSVPALLALQCQRLVLVEGDSETADMLQAACAGSSAEIQVCVVAASSGPVTWYRYNMRALNGPTVANGLNRVYPRLRQIGSSERDAVRIADCVREAAPADGTRTGLLIIDLPGQMRALLEGLPAECLDAFRYVLVRYSSELDGEELPAADSLGALASACFAVYRRDDDSEPLWPAVLFEVDRAAEVRAARDQKIGELQAALELAEQASATRLLKLQAVEAERVALSSSHAAAVDELSRLVSERDSLAQAKADLAESLLSITQERAAEQLRIRALEDERDQALEAAAIAEKARADQEGLEQHAARLGSRVSELERQLSGLATARDAQIASLVAANDKHLADQKAAHDKQFATLVAGHAKAMGERDASLIALQQQLAELQTEHDNEKAALIEANGRQLADQKTTHDMQLADLRAAHEKQLADQKATHDEHAAAIEADHARVMAESGAGLAALRKQLAEQEVMLEQHQLAHQQQIAGLTAAHAQEISERDSGLAVLQKQLVDQRNELKERIARLEQQLDDRITKGDATQVAAAAERAQSSARIQMLELQLAEVVEARGALESRLATAEHARAAQAALAAERGAQIEALLLSQSELEESLRQGRESTRRQDAESEELRKELADSVSRQAMLREELARAEAQIELIKDLLRDQIA